MIIELLFFGILVSVVITLYHITVIRVENELVLRNKGRENHLYVLNGMLIHGKQMGYYKACVYCKGNFSVQLEPKTS